MNERYLFEHAEYLLKLALKKTESFEQAEDIVSETLISAIVSLKNKNQIENPKAYLSGILNHKFNDFLRSKYSKPTISYGVIPEFDFVSKEDSTLDKLIQKEEAENVRRIISQLSKNYREVLVRHYIHGQNVQSIADELELNANTVKSRLNTARMNVKTEMEKENMENYEKQSYEPEELDIWMLGELDVECSAFYTNNWTHRIQQNILILAYKKPLTITEISQGLGISAAYIEPIVEELISYDFMARTGDKVYTTFLIFTQEEKFKAYDHDKAIAEKYAKPMWEVLETYLEKIRQKDFYKKMNKRQQASLLQFAAIFIIQEACREVEYEKWPKPKSMEIKHECGGTGSWYGYAYGFSQPLNTEPDWDYVTGHSLCKLNGCHSVSTGRYKDLEEIRFYAYDVVAGFTFSQWRPLDDLQFLKVAYALYAEEEEEIPLITPNFFDPEVIKKYEQYHFIGKEPDSENPDSNCAVEVLNLPVLTHEELEELYKNIFHESILDFEAKFHTELGELFVNPVEPPKHLKEAIPESLKYQLCADAFVMALVYQGAWNGYYKCEYPIGKDWVPACVITLGKKLTTEELTNVDLWKKDAGLENDLTER